MKITEKDAPRFWSKVDKTGNCWEWLAGKIRGYGSFGIGRKKYLAHRAAWALAHDYRDIPPGMCVLHACDNPGCVNPRHLFIGTQADNMRDMSNKGRGNQPKGEDHGRSKLTVEKISEIRAKYIPIKYSQRKLAKEYGVAQPVIHHILHRTTWTHI